RRRSTRQLLGSGKRVELVFKISLGVSEFGGLAVESPRLERLALQRCVEHEQAGHTDPEDPDQYQQKRESRQARRRFGYGVQRRRDRSDLLTPTRDRRP